MDGMILLVNHAIGLFLDTYSEIDLTFAFSEHDLPLPPVTCKSHFPRETIDAYRSTSFERMRRSTLTAFCFRFETLKGGHEC